MRASWRLTIACAFLFGASAARASPPLGAFPDVVVPEGSAPANARIFAFGANAPRAEDLGASVTANGVVLTPEIVTVGCCLVEVRAAIPPGAAVAVVIVTSSGDRTLQFTAGNTIDSVAPVLTTAGIISQTETSLIVGLVGTDEEGLAGFLGRVDGSIVSAAPAGRAMSVSADCVDVTALDLAGNESAPTRLCREEESDEESPAPPPEPRPDGCSANQLGAASALFSLASFRPRSRTAASRLRRSILERKSP